MILAQLLTLLLTGPPDFPVDLGQMRSKLVVVAFIGTECPLARLYASRLNEISRHSDVTVVGINPNDRDTLADIALFRQQFGLEFPIVKDVGHQAADRFGATRQLEVFLLDKERTVRYHGRIDDQYNPGMHRLAPSRNDLLAAIEELLADQTVSVPTTPFPGCLIERPRPAITGQITYHGQVAAILNNRCIECHRPGEIGPFSLASYQDAAAWTATIRERVMDGSMPPWHADPAFGRFMNDRRLSDEEKQLLLAWIDSGAAQGDPTGVTPAKSFPDGWTIGSPDKIIVLPEPVQIPADGVLDYITVELDPGFVRDTWVCATEIRPGNRTIVHHAKATIGPPGMKDELDSGHGAVLQFADYVPGMMGSTLPQGMARLVPAGWHVYLTIHYVTTGLAATDQTRVGMILTEAATNRVFTHNIVNDEFTIAPFAANQCVEQTWTVPCDALLLAMFPHMHLRGKSFSYEAVYPTGATEVLLKVPHYDFMWQHRYVLAQPKRLPAGTLLRAVATYDNSSANAANPDPAATVRYGTQTTDEMFNGYVDIAIIERPRRRYELAVVAIASLWLFMRWKRQSLPTIDKRQ